MIDGDDCGEISGMNEWQGKPEFSERNLHQCRSVHHRPRMTSLGFEPGQPRLKPTINRLSYGMACYGDSFIMFEVITAVTMKNGVFCDVTPCGSCKNQRFGGT
jgi:hypothetical protein